MDISMIFRLAAALLTYLSLKFFFFWTVAGLFSLGRPDQAGLADALAIVCAGLVWYFWPKSKKQANQAERNSDSKSVASQAEKASEPRFGSRIIFCALIAGGIGFAGGFFGPILLTPKSNLGPLLGILITGPLGFMLGPVIGVATLIRKTTLKSLCTAWLWLIVSWVLACGFYNFLAAPAVGLMIITIAVAAALFVHTLRRLAPPSAAVNYGLILLGGALSILCLSAFPPVVAPSWGNAPLDGAPPLPSFAFLMDSGFDASHHVPRYAINKPLWRFEMLLVLVLMALGLMTARLMARRSGGADGNPPVHAENNSS
jgi:hypothetical protein